MSNFVLLPRSLVATKGYLEFLLPLYKTDVPNGQFSTAVSAVALASLANRPNSKNLLPKAREIYTKALALTNAALRDPVQAKTDQTLSSVLLLGIFEVCPPHEIY